MRGTRRDRLKALVKLWKDAGSPTEDDWPNSEFEIRPYKGERRILQEPQPWIGEISPGAGYNRLEECDRLVMNAIKESDRLPRLEGGFDVDTPERGPEPSPSPREDLKWPADIYDDIPPLEGPEDSDEGSEIEVQGTVCAVAPVQKGKGCC